MLDKIPNAEEMTALVGQSLYAIWNKLCALIDEKYDMECLWNKGGKAWTYEYKYRRGGKTLCALYARENCVGFMIILGKDERLKFDTDRNSYSKEVQKIYDEIIYVFLTIFLYLLKCPQSLILSALRAFCLCGKPHISRLIFLYFPCQSWLKSW